VPFPRTLRTAALAYRAGPQQIAPLGEAAPLSLLSSPAPRIFQAQSQLGPRVYLGR